jgi:hypothetical protein
MHHFMHRFVASSHRIRRSKCRILSHFLIWTQCLRVKPHALERFQGHEIILVIPDIYNYGEDKHDDAYHSIVHCDISGRTIGCQNLRIIQQRDQKLNINLARMITFHTQLKGIQTSTVISAAQQRIIAINHKISFIVSVQSFGLC